jgi:hypothetical protein
MRDAHWGMPSLHVALTPFFVIVFIARGDGGRLLLLLPICHPPVAQSTAATLQ